MSSNTVISKMAYFLDYLTAQFYFPTTLNCAKRHILCLDLVVDADIEGLLNILLCISSGMSARNGTDVDGATAIKCFTSLGYKIKFANDQTVDQIKKLMLSGKKCY